MATVLITGNTFPVKEALKALGGKWKPAVKGWEVPAEKADEARALVAAAPKSGPRWSPKVRGGWGRPPVTSGSNYTRFSSGAEVFTNKNGRCEDAPCCGCCS